MSQLRNKAKEPIGFIIGHTCSGEFRLIFSSDNLIKLAKAWNKRSNGRKKKS